MKIRFREISPYHEPFLAERIEHMIDYITVLHVFIRRIRYLIIRQFRVKHTKAIVMLGREDEVFATRTLHNISPLRWFKQNRIEQAIQTPVPLFEFFIVHSIAYLPAPFAKTTFA